MARLIEIAPSFVIDLDDLQYMEDRDGKTILALKSGRQWTWSQPMPAVYAALRPYFAPTTAQSLNPADHYKRGYNAGYKAGRRGKPNPHED